MGKKQIKRPTVAELNEIRQQDESKRAKFLAKSFGGVEGLAKALGSDASKGLPKKEVKEAALEARREEFGSNELPEPPPTPLWVFIIEELKDPILILLIVAAAVSLIIGVALPPHTDFFDGLGILVAVVVVTGVGSGQNYSKELKFRALNKVKNDRAIKVWRAGELDERSVNELVVGDVVELHTGDFVPADGVFIEGDNLICDESAMTGESDGKKKNAERPVLLSGCSVTEGQGKFMITSAGVNSEWGELYTSLAEEKPDDTPLEETLEFLAKLIGYFGFAVAILLFIVLTIQWFVLLGEGLEPEGLLFLEYLILAIVIIVVAVPEGLPLAVTISLAYSMNSMLKDNNLVRNLAACETMGGATQICSDKTGTLTQNRMTVTAMWAAGQLFNSKKDFEKKVKKSLPEKTVKLFVQASAINSNAFLKEVETEIEGKGSVTNVEFFGSKTECALLLAARNMGYDYKEVRDKYAGQTHGIPFSSDRKRMSTCFPGKKGTAILQCKGASEIVLARCDTFIGENGEVQKLSKSLRKELEGHIEALASDGLRTLVLGYRVVDKEFSEVDEEDENELTLICLVGIADPLRPEVPDAVRDCQRAGITVRMVTGDNKLTAQRIAKDCGIYNAKRGDVVVEGPEFRDMSDEDLAEIIDKMTVLARSKPNDKMRLVKFLKARREVVAATGDGTNDAPALKAANVGMAMGIAGTEIAKEASDIIIMDDNFASIVKAVKWGRNVRASIQKFLQFQMTINVVACLVAFVGGVTGKGEPLTPIQLLWVNLQMDSLAALALATDKPQDSLLDAKPAGRERRLISGAMWRNILIGSIWEMFILFLILYGQFWGDLIKEEPEVWCESTLTSSGDDVECPPRLAGETHYPTQRYTFLFNTFVWMQLFNEINCRRITELNVFEDFWTNKVFLGVLFVTIVLQVLFIVFPGRVMGVVPFPGLSGELWGLSIVLGFTMMIVGFVCRLLPVWEPDWMVIDSAALKQMKDEEAGDDVDMDAAGVESSDASSSSEADDDTDEEAPSSSDSTDGDSNSESSD